MKIEENKKELLVEVKQKLDTILAKIDLLNANQMYELLMFITKHEMGADYYKEHFGQNNMFVKSTIFRGISEAINSYNGELGKL